MKKDISVVALILSVIFAFVFLTVKIGTHDMGGITGTIVVKPGTSENDIRTTLSVLRVAGIGWSYISVLCLVWVPRNFRR